VSNLTPQQFARVESLFFEAGKIPEQQREAFLAAACDDPAIRDEVVSLLRQSSDNREGSGIGLSSAPPLIGEVGRVLTPTKHSVHALVGKRVGAYEILSVIGHGGMGVVYLARDTRLGREIAIKAIPPAYTDHPARLARFVREAKMLASLSHPNIATVHGLEEFESSQLLVMERVEGKTLSRKLADGALPIAEALSVCRQIAEGVEAAHDAGVIHRDL
jgi:serine/threonine protein kinase